MAHGKQHLNMAVKELGDDGSFTGMLAAYNNVDLGGDKIIPGAFTKTIQEHGSTVPMLWQHKQDTPIGTLTLEDTPQGLRVKGQLLMTDETAQKAYRFLKAGIVKGLSIGYDTIKDSFEGGVRLLKELRLWEGSVVTFPMNPMSLIDSVKSAPFAKKDFSSELNAVQLQDAQYQLMNALWAALSELAWSDMARDEKVSAGAQVCADFTAAYMEYLPAYLDYLAETYGMKSDDRAREVKAQALAQSLVLATKEGRKFSSDTLDTLRKAHGHVKAAHENLVSADQVFNALFTDEADDDNIDDDDPDDNEGDEDADDEGEDDGSKAADTSRERKAAAKKTEPDGFHSATKTLDEMIHTLRAR